MLNYLDKTLSPSEKLLYRGRIHSLFKLRIWALFFALLGLIAWATSAYPNQFTWPYAAARYHPCCYCVFADNSSLMDLGNWPDR